MNKRDMKRTAKSFLRLRFSEDLEEIFLEDYFQKTLIQLRVFVLLGLFLYSVFGILDIWIVPEVKYEVWFIRYAVICPYLIFVLLFSFSSHFKKFVQPLLVLVIFLAGLGIIAMMALASSPGNYLYYGGIILTIIYSYTLSTLRFAYGNFVAWSVVVIYEIIAVWISRTPFPIFLNNNFFLISASLIGMLAGYQREYYIRRDFIKNRVIRELEGKKYLLEKEKILRELHDGLGGIITNISLLADIAQNAPCAEDAKKPLNTISDLSREGLSEIRGFIHSLDTKEATWHTMTSELRNQGSTMLESHGITFHINASADNAAEQPGSLLCLNLFRIYKEALMNIIKHSKARNVHVGLTVGREGLALSIRDDGVGLENRGARGRGLSNMKTRAQEIGGNVTVTDDRDNGTLVSLEIPLPLKYPDERMELS